MDRSFVGSLALSAALIVACNQTTSDSSSFLPLQTPSPTPGFVMLQSLDCVSVDNVGNALTLQVTKTDKFVTAREVNVKVTARTSVGAEYSKDLIATAHVMTEDALLISDTVGNAIHTDNAGLALVPTNPAEKAISAKATLKTPELVQGSGAAERQVNCLVQKKDFGDVTPAAKTALWQAVYNGNQPFSASLRAADAELRRLGYTRDDNKIAVANSHSGEHDGDSKVSIPYTHTNAAWPTMKAEVNVKTRFQDGKFTVLDLTSLSLTK
jgi:hypothetical protein